MVCETDKETKKRMNYNKIVHTLSNKAGSFESGAFPDNNFFEPSSSQSKEWLKIQKYLMLDSLRTDYYLNFALGILEAHPDIRDLIGSKRETYDVFDLPKLRSEIEGAIFSDNGIYYSKFLKYSYTFPIPEIYTLKYNSESTVEIFDGEKAHLKKCRIVKSYGDGLAMPQSFLHFDWSDELPLKGVLAYTGQWEEGANITIEFVPHSIDVKAMLEAIEESNDISSFLQESALYESYLLARSDQEKLAILYAALSLQNESWNDFVSE